MGKSLKTRNALSHTQILISHFEMHLFFKKQKKKIVILLKIESPQNMVLSVIVLVYLLPLTLFSNAFSENCFAVLCEITGVSTLLTSHAS